MQTRNWPLCMKSGQWLLSYGEPVQDQPQIRTATDATISPKRFAEGIDKIAPWTLTYHEVEPDKSSYLYAVTRAQLDEELSLISERNRQLGPGSPVARVTFDDGHVSNLQVAGPVLERHSVPAIFFITAGRVEERPQTMTWVQLRSLVEAGHSVQSHGWSHKFLTHCSDSELTEELQRSKEEMQNHLGVPVEWISVPGGRWNRRVVDAARAAGYSRMYTSDFWRKPAQSDGITILGRLMIRNTTTTSQLEQWLSTDVSSLRMLRAKGHVKDAVRAVLGDQTYHRLWCWLADERGSGMEGEA